MLNSSIKDSVFPSCTDPEERFCIVEKTKVRIFSFLRVLDERTDCGGWWWSLSSKNLEQDADWSLTVGLKREAEDVVADVVINALALLEIEQDDDSREEEEEVELLESSLSFIGKKPSVIFYHKR